MKHACTDIDDSRSKLSSDCGRRYLGNVGLGPWLQDTRITLQSHGLMGEACIKEEDQDYRQELLSLSRLSLLDPVEYVRLL
jgi:hypothetical protein